MISLVIKDCGEGVCAEPRRGQNVCASLALEKEGEPERNVGPMGRIERLEGSL